MQNAPPVGIQNDSERQSTAGTELKLLGQKFIDMYFCRMEWLVGQQ